MPLNILGTMLVEGPDKVPGWPLIKKYGPVAVTAALGKYYFGGSSNTWERDLHGKVYIVTGGTSGIGAALVREMATRGAQLVLLTSQLNDDEEARTSWISDYVQDLREETGNFLIYAEGCDLSSLYSVRKFATKWLDQSPPRRLDGVMCLAAESAPMGKMRESSVDGVELQTAINYLGHFHLLTLLEPALKVQLADRDVRVLLTSCMSQAAADLDATDILWENRKYPHNQPWKVYGTSKLLLNLFAREYQRRLDSFERKDGQPNNTRINIVNPGIARTPSTRRVLSMGTVWGLLLYVLLYPIWWFLLKSCEQGMQTYLFGLNSPEFVKRRGGNYLKECTVIQKESRPEFSDTKLQAELFDKTKDLIAELEKRSALERNRLKKPEDKAKKTKKASKTSESAKKEHDKLSVFASAFSSSGEMAAPMAAPGTGSRLNPDDEVLKSLRLRSLDQKLDKSRTTA